MYTLIPLTLLLLWNGLDSNMLQVPEMADILSKARVLCPYNSLCEEPPLSTATLASGKIPCCTDCSCRPDCNLRNDCCFPAQSSRIITSECLYPFTHLIFGIVDAVTRYRMVVDVANCQTRFPLFSSDITVTEENDTSIKNKPEEVSGKCGKCECDIDIEKNSYDKCVCNGPTVNENAKCTCGEVQVAPWGSFFPVYSRSSDLIYKNPVCASCHGVTDGVVWNPLVTCSVYSLHFIERILEQTFHGGACAVAFISPKTLDISRFPRCAHIIKKSCSGQELLVPHYLNMTSDEVVSACNSNFSSPYTGGNRNVFCSLCTGRYHKECVDDSGLKFGETSLTFLLNAEFLEENSKKRVGKRQPVACSKSKPSECRKMLCPSGQVRYANGLCDYPMTAAYIQGFRLVLRLYPETPAPIQELIDLLPGKKIDTGHVVTPWPKTWITFMTVLETTKVLSSGDVVNTTAFIVAVALSDPDSDFMSVLESVKRIMKRQCFFKVNNVTIALKSEFLEHISMKYNAENTAMMPPGFTYENEMNLSVPNWTLQWVMRYSIKSLQPITKLMFCEQVMLNSNEYTLTAGEKILYEKLQGKFFYTAQFVYDVEGNHSVRVCIDDTEFVQVVQSSQTYLQSAIVCVILSTAIFFIF